ncbi:MAG: hypothetical protein J0I90_08490 [Nitrosospira sp.]|nr:hypothetical protein [Nitrosospira sp.]
MPTDTRIWFVLDELQGEINRIRNKVAEASEMAHPHLIRLQQMADEIRQMTVT